MGVGEREPVKKRNEEVKPSLKVKGRKYGHLHLMPSNIITVIVIILESFQKKDQEAFEIIYME